MAQVQQNTQWGFVIGMAVQNVTYVTNPRDKELVRQLSIRKSIEGYEI